MKKLFLSVASLLLLLGSCTQNEVEEIALSKKQNVVVATIEGQKTRLSVDYDDTANQFNLSWSTGDAFKVFGGVNPVEYTWSQGDEFTTTTTPEDPTYAVYPSSANLSINGTTVSMTLSATPSVANINLPMWADASNGNAFSFKHLAAALQFKLNQIPEGYNKLIVEASNAISGSFTAKLDDETPILESTSTDDADEKVTVSFEAATSGTKDQDFYIPLPVGTYTSLAVSVSNGTETKALKSWENLTIERGKMYYTTATVDVASADAVNEALANVTTTPTTVNLTEEITVQEGDAIEIPDDAENVTLNFEAAPVTTENTPLVINQNDEATSGDATSELNITMPDDAEGLHATINAPTTTVTLVGGTYESIEATTATNTLIIGEGVTIKNLTIKKGNVELYGKLEKFTSEDATTIKLMKDIDLTSEWEIKQGMEVTLDLNGYTLAVNNATNHGIDNEGTLTINGNDGKITWVATNYADNAVYCIVNRAGATMNIDACEVAGPVYNVGNMTVENESKLTTNAANRAALICGEDTKDIAWTFTMTSGSIVSETHSAAVLKNNYYGLNPQGLGKFDGVTFTGTTYYDIVLCAVNVEVNNCTFTSDNIWLKADKYVSYVNGKETRKEDLYPCKWSEIYGTPITTLDALTAALAAAPIDGTTTTIVLDDNINVTSELEIKPGMNVALDLNGYTLAVNNATNHGIDNEGTLTINGNDGKITWVATDHADNAVYCIVNRAGATMNIDACEVAGPVYNVGNMTLENESKLTTNAANRAALICGEDTNDIAWTFTMTGGSIVSETHSAAVLKNNYYGLNPQGLGNFDGVTFTGTTYYDIVLCAVNVEVNNCTFTSDNIWLKADKYVSYVNGKETRKENLYPCKWSEIFPATNE